MIKPLRRCLLLLGLAALANLAQGATAERVPSLEAGVTMPGFWYAAAAQGPAPAMLLLHGCGGVYGRGTQPAERYRELAGRLNALGIHVLVTDSLTPRGESELCTQRIGSRKVTQVQRRHDVLGALQWLAGRTEVDRRRLGVLGWSHGGSAVLAATNLRHPEVAGAAVRPSLAVAFYPGCGAELQRGYEAVAPLLLLLGEADDWTPAAPCEELARHAGAVKAQFEVYAGAYHGFDGNGRLRVRNDVPNGVRPGRGVHVGANPAARDASALRLARFLREEWALQ